MEIAPYVITSSDLVRNPKVYLDEILQGNVGEIFIERYGQVIAKMIPVQPKKTKKAGN